MKRYLVFKGDYYYPIGGALDLVLSTDSLEKGKEEAEKLGEEQWSHIFDLNLGSIIFERAKS